MQEPALTGVSDDVLRAVRRIEIASVRLVNEVFTGEYTSVFRGQGLEFAEVRPYEPGDDIRAIDWSASARMGQPYVKRHVEERESVMMLLFDVSGSLRVGSRALKSRYVAEAAAVLALAAVKNNDKVGLILFSDRVEKYVPPRKGRRHALRVVRETLTHRASHEGTDIASALAFFGRVTRRHSIAFVLSDFHASEYEAPLKRVSQRHDVTAVAVRDPIESTPPGVGLVRWIDAETGSIRVAEGDTGDDARAPLSGELMRSRVDSISLSTDAPYVEPLLDFFKRRKRRRHRT